MTTGASGFSEKELEKECSWRMISSDAALGLAVLFFYLSMMFWGVFQTFWPSKAHGDRPGGGHRVRKWRVETLVLEPEKVHQRPSKRRFRP